MMMVFKKSKYPTSFNTYKEFLDIFDSIPEKNRLEWTENLDPNLLRIKNKDGWTVAHMLAWSGTLPEKFVLSPERGITEELLRMKEKGGWTVAHGLAESGTLPERFITEELLRMKNNDGSTIAHALARRGTLPEKFVTDELLRMKDKDGWTVAGCCYIFLSRNNRWDLLTPAVLEAPCEDKTPMIDKVTEDLSGMNDVKLERVFFLLSGETRMKLLSDIKNPDLLERVRKCLDRETEKEALETSPDGEQDLHSEGQESLYCGVRSDR